MAVTVKGRSVYHIVEELIVIAQGFYQVSTYKLVMKARHFSRNLVNTFDSLPSSIPECGSFVPNRSGRGNWSKSAQWVAYTCPFFNVMRNERHPTQKVMSFNQRWQNLVLRSPLFEWNRDSGFVLRNHSDSSLARNQVSQFQLQFLF